MWVKHSNTLFTNIYSNTILAVIQLKSEFTKFLNEKKLTFSWLIENVHKLNIYKTKLCIT